MTFSHTFTEFVDEVSDHKKTDEPQIKIDNPLDRKVFINQIQIIPTDPQFSDYAIVDILVNDVSIFCNKTNPDFFASFELYDLPIAKNELERFNSIKIFVWDEEAVSRAKSAIFIIHVSEENNPVRTGSIPKQRNTVNSITGLQNSNYSSLNSVISQIQALDLDNNGIIDAVEIQQAKTDDVKAAIQALDVNGDGVISAIELATVTPDSVKRRASTQQTLFSQQDYSDETNTQAIDLDGYTKMILIVANAVGEALSVIQDDFGFADNSIVIDKDLSTKTDAQGGATTKDIVIDFGSDASRIPKATFLVGGSPASTNVDVELAVSDDDVSYSTVDSANYTSGFPFDNQTLEGSGTSFRYLRLRYIYNSGSVGNVQIYEMYDGNKLGGEIAISFEVYDSSSNQWIEIISADDIGSVGLGGQFSKMLGDVINDKSSDKFNVILPSLTSNFRAKMTVTGNINTSVSIVKVD